MFEIFWQISKIENLKEDCEKFVNCVNQRENQNFEFSKKKGHHLCFSKIFYFFLVDLNKDFENLRKKEI